MKRPFKPPHAGIITGKLFNEVQKRLSARNRRRPRTCAPSINFLLAIHGLRTFDSVSHLRAIVDRCRAYQRN